MNSIRTTKARLVSLALVVFCFFGALPSQAASLGISVNVDAQSDSSNRSSSKEIWFLGEQGSKVTRRISVGGLSDVAQNLELRYYEAQIINGEKTYQQTELSKTQDWFRFTDESPSVEPGEVKTFEIVVTIPPDAREELVEGLMVVIATAKKQVEVDNPGGGAVGIIAAEAGIGIPFKLAIGDMSALRPMFSIQGVEGVLIDGERYLRTFFRNEGTVPIILAGSVQLSDAVFVDRLFGPYEYRSREIAAGALGFIDIVADPDIVEGNYSAFVIAEQLGVKESRVFDVYIEYLSPGTLKFWDLAPWLGLVLVSGILMVIGIRLFRSSSDQDPDLETAATPKKPKAEKIRKAKAPKAAKAKAVNQTKNDSPRKIQREQTETVRPKTPTVEELLDSLKLRDSAQKPIREPKAKKAKREPKAKKAKTVRESSNSSGADHMPPPPELDPWEFLRAGREGRWNDTSQDQGAKKKQAARRPPKKQ